MVLTTDPPKVSCKKSDKMVVAVVISIFIIGISVAVLFGSGDTNLHFITVLLCPRP